MADHQITYPFSLRPDVIVELRIPRDLTLKEAERLSNFLESLVVEEHRDD